LPNPTQPLEIRLEITGILVTVTPVQRLMQSWIMALVINFQVKS